MNQLIKQALPFGIKQIQTDDGSEFSDQFSWQLEDLSIRHRKTRLCSPEENGKVERSHRTDEQEFYAINRSSTDLFPFSTLNACYISGNRNIIPNDRTWLWATKPLANT